MHFISETRYNPKTQCDDCYYRIKESFRDLTGRPRHRLMLTVGFIDEDLSPYDIRDIGRCLTWLHEHQGRQDLFGDAMSRYKEVVRRLALKYWDEMVKAGSVEDRFFRMKLRSWGGGMQGAGNGNNLQRFGGGPNGNNRFGGGANGHNRFGGGNRPQRQNNGK